MCILDVEAGKDLKTDKTPLKPFKERHIRNSEASIPTATAVIIICDSNNASEFHLLSTVQQYLPSKTHGV